jgi:hypothetical protein
MDVPANETVITRKRLLEKINHLGTTEHIEIFKILKEKCVPVTENKNGVFFNLSTVQPEIFKVIEDFVNYCYTNKHELDKYDQKLHECKFYQKHNYTSQYSINEPKDRKDVLKEIMDNVDNTGKNTRLKDFVAKMTSSAERVNVKKSCGKFIMCKKQLCKRQECPDALIDCLEGENE